MGRTTVAVCLGLLFLGGDPVRGAEPDWKVGLARVKITPDKPIFMAGYASRNKPFEKVASDLYAKALALEDRDGHTAVLVTTDLIGLQRAVAEPVCERIASRSGLTRGQILLSSSHTHTGPTLSLDPTPRDGRAAGDAQRTVEYTRQLQDRLVEVALAALKKREPARLSWGTGVANFVMNRREFTPNGVILGVNPRGPADRTVPVLRVDSPDGKLRAVLFGAGTHNTTLTDRCYEICADYAGFAQAYVEQQHPGAEALFLLGCAGDSNPYPRGTMELSRAHGKELGQEVCRVLGTKLRPVRGPLRTAFDRVALPLQEPPSRAEVEKQAGQKGGKLPTEFTCPVAVWQFGDDLTLVALPEEVVVDYVALLEKALGPNKLWPAAYCNDVSGYVPSARVLAEGGYETRGLYLTDVGLFSPRAQDVLVNKVRELAEKADRPLPRRPVR